ncbi:hypothetical protein, partial [Salmonella enterica]|uniref:hypothetical protein n=1 Tax=Salmonella enterica TaxID=28901 RepID=UPI002A75F08D
ADSLQRGLAEGSFEQEFRLVVGFPGAGDGSCNTLIVRRKADSLQRGLAEGSFEQEFRLVVGFPGAGDGSCN